MMGAQKPCESPQGLSQVLEDVTREVLRKQPKDIPAFTAELLRERLVERQRNTDIREEESSAGSNNNMAREGMDMGTSISAPPQVESEQVTEDSGGGLAPPPSYRRGRRVSVSAESMNPDQFAAMEKVVHPKTDEQARRIRAIVKDNLLFSALDEEQMVEVVQSMFEKPTAVGEDIIKQGDDGDYFYVVESGAFDIYVAQYGEEPQNLGTIKASGSFGELALMYNAPRAATIRCVEDAVLWAMDRITFRRILMDTTSKKRRMYETFLSEIKILECIESYERVKIADGLEAQSFSAGEDIIKQGETGDKFYLLERGTVAVIVDDDEVGELKQGDYFGELALLFSQPRKATVRAKNDVKVAYLGVDAFNRMLGPCSAIMQRNVSVYEEQVAEAKGNKTQEGHMEL